MADISVQRASRSGAVISKEAANAGGDSFANDGNTIFRVANESGGAITVTFESPNACSFGVISAAHDLEVEIEDGAEVEIGTFSQGQFNDANGKVQVSYTATTSVTVAAVAR